MAYSPSARSAPVQEDGARTSTLALNVFPVRFSAGQASFFVGPFRDEVDLEVLRSSAAGWSAARDRADGSRVFVWVHAGEGEFTRAGYRPATVSLSENASLYCSVLLDGIDRHLRAQGLTRLPGLTHRYANWGTGNLLDKVLGDALGHDPRIGIYPEISIETFVTRGESDRPFVGLIVDVDTVTRLDVPIDDVIRSGFDVHGRYVKLLGVADEELTGDEGKLIGRVRAIDGEFLELEDVRNLRYARTAMNRCVLDPDRVTFQEYMAQRLGAEFVRKREALDSEHLNWVAPSNRFRRTQQFVDVRLGRSAAENIPLAGRLTATVGDGIRPAASAASFRVTELPPPLFSFDPESARTHAKASEGLRVHGPYSRERMRGSKPRILVISPDVHKGQVEAFLGKFRHGIGNGRVYDGFTQKYRLDGVTLEERYFTLRGTPRDAYYNATVEALHDQEYDAAFVVIQESYKTLPAAQDPYCVSKALLLSFGIPVQEIEIETIRKDERSLQWAMQNIALATYAKVGGSPFVLRARQLKMPELIFGIGRGDATDETRLGGRTQIIGFTAVFRSDGDYLLNSCTPYVDISQYEKHLEELVLRVVSEVASAEGIADGSALRLVFHVYKSTGRREVGAIENAIAKLPRYRIEYALLHVSDAHRIRLYDTATALHIAARRTTVEIGPRERLVALIGPEQYLGRGTPTPMRVRLDKASTFPDLDYLTQQLYEFSAVSWRTFNLSTQPVTVGYAELMARLNIRLKQVVTAWNQEIVRTKLRRKLWFI